MSFNPDPNKQAVQVIFFIKVKRKYTVKSILIIYEHKHLCLNLDSKLSFASYINEKINIARKGVGIIKHLPLYLSVSTLDQIYKMYVRPHLEFCDVIFNTPKKFNEFSIRKKKEVLKYQKFVFS